MSRQRGFTLLELMVAMVIFAMLAVAGWQVFDSVNRARERAQLQADNLAVLQYAYLQLQQDMGQIIAYQTPNTENSNSANNNTNSSNTNTNNNNANSAELPIIAPEPFMRLDSEQVSFVRFADPDPRYQSSPSLQRIEYIFADQRLIRRQYTSIQGGSDSVSLDSVLLEGVTATRWQALLPKPSNRFPDKDSSNNSSSSNNNSSSSNANNAATAASANEISLVPKGIAVSFTYQEMPISWQWSLAPQPLALNDISKANTGSSGNNNSNNNQNSGNNNQNNPNNSGSSN